MSGHLLAVLILMTAEPQQSEVRRQEREARPAARSSARSMPAQRVVHGRRPAPPPGGQVVAVMTNHDRQRNIHYITITMPENQKKKDENDEDDDDPMPRVFMPPNLQTAVLERENLDRWVFDEDGTTEERWRHLRKLLDDRIAADSLGHRLTPTEKARLRVAGKGDIKRFLDQVEGERTRFEKDRKGWRTGVAALRRLDPLATIYVEGPFGVESLYAKTLRRIKAEPPPGEQVPGADR